MEDFQALLRNSGQVFTSIDNEAGAGSRRWLRIERSHGRLPHMSRRRLPPVMTIRGYRAGLAAAVARAPWVSGYPGHGKSRSAPYE
jgi:hypothetical protein